MFAEKTATATTTITTTRVWRHECLPSRGDNQIGASSRLPDTWLMILVIIIIIIISQSSLSNRNSHFHLLINNNNTHCYSNCSAATICERHEPPLSLSLSQTICNWRESAESIDVPTRRCDCRFPTRLQQTLPARLHWRLTQSQRTEPQHSQQVAVAVAFAVAVVVRTKPKTKTSVAAERGRVSVLVPSTIGALLSLTSLQSVLRRQREREREGVSSIHLPLNRSATINIATILVTDISTT